MDKIRILLSFDNSGKRENIFLDDKIFDVDTRNILSIGTEKSADTLFEYDAVIFNFESAFDMAPERLSQLYEFIKRENKLFIYILNRYSINGHLTNTQILNFLFYNLSKGKGIDIINTKSSGREFDFTDKARNNILFRYLNTKNKSWAISFVDGQFEFLKPLAKNKEDNLVAFLIQDSLVKSVNAFVPWFPENKDLFWEGITFFLTSQKTNFEDVAGWVKDYTFPDLQILLDRIDEKDKQIKALEKEKVDFENEKKKFEKIRNVLMYHDGNLLKDVCKEVLLELGLDISEGEPGREDLFFIYDNNHYLIEVKGCEKSANKGHIKQVSSHKTEYKNDKEVEVKGILLINAWRKFPLEERDTPDKPIFPDEIMKLVKLSDILLMTTQQLFVAYCGKLEDKFSLVQFIEKLQNSNGLLEGYNNIIDFKKNQ